MTGQALLLCLRYMCGACLLFLDSEKPTSNRYLADMYGNCLVFCTLTIPEGVVSC